MISIPSIGDISAFELLAELGPIMRFPSLKRAQGYAGLVPTLMESGGKEKKKKLLKRGNRRLRSTLVQCAKTLVYSTKNISPRFRDYINKVVQKNVGIEKKIWVVLAKKLLRIGIALLRSGRPFDSLLIEQSEREKMEKESKTRKKQINFFKKQLAKLHQQFNFSFMTLRAMIDEVASYEATNSRA